MLQNIHKCCTPCSVIQKWCSLFTSDLSFVGINLTAKRKIFIWWHVVLYHPTHPPTHKRKKTQKLHIFGRYRPEIGNARLAWHMLAALNIFDQTKASPAERKTLLSDLANFARIVTVGRRYVGWTKRCACCLGVPTLRSTLRTSNSGRREVKA